MVGFLAKQHHGVLVHHGSSAPIHVIEANGRSGHVDAIAAGPAVTESPHACRYSRPERGKTGPKLA